MYIFHLRHNTLFPDYSNILTIAFLWLSAAVRARRTLDQTCHCWLAQQDTS